jgi:anti-sigma28 factor (negative regulator of flagellin synthesis)
MNNLMMEKITNIEKMVMEINSKIDNFLGVENLSEGEKEKVREIREEIKKGNYVRYDEISWE